MIFPLRPSLRLLGVLGIAASCTPSPSPTLQAHGPADLQVLPLPEGTTSENLDVHQPRAVAGGFESIQPSWGLHSTFTDSEAVIRPMRSHEPIAFQFQAWGREEALSPIGVATPNLGGCVSPDLVDSNGDCLTSVEYAYPGVTLWWLNRPEGLEQGWIAYDRPTGAGDLIFELSVTGAELLGESDAATLITPDGVQVQYAGIAAWDATGASVEATIEVADGKLRVRVQDRDAEYPITVDPWLNTLTRVAFGSNGDGAGASVGANDFDGDGYADVWYGVPNHAFGSGAFRVHLGGAGGPSPMPNFDITASGGASHVGLGGWAGDLNGDGLDDAIGGAPDEVGSGVAGGSFKVLYGTANGNILDFSGPELDGPVDNVHMGLSFAVGDFNDDNLPDIASGGTGDGANLGRVYVFFGTGVGAWNPTPVLVGTGSHLNDKFGSTLAAGDLNNDGFDDLAIGAPDYDCGTDLDCGLVSVYLGTTAGNGYFVPYTQASGGPGSKNGTGLGIGHVWESDAFADLIMGRPGETSSLKVLVMPGKSTGLDLSGGGYAVDAEASSRFGSSIAVIPDSNGNGIDEIAIGAPWGHVGTNEGSIYIAEFPSGSSFAVVRGSAGVSTPGDEQIGTRIAVGDINGDGRPDIVTSNPWVGGGSIYVLYGAADDDNDGYAENIDCNDKDAAIHPGATEVSFDRVDQDCNGFETCYVDYDGDGYGPPSAITNQGNPSCSGSTGFGTSFAYKGGDCNDNNPSAYPGGTETIGDGIDQDCDTHDKCYQDLDDDEYGSGATVTSTNASCGNQEANATGDCDDNASSSHPGATEIAADGIDQDCNSMEACYADLDQDGFGNPELALIGSADADCTDPGESAVNSDCDDTSDDAFPGNTEVNADGIDGNCDGFELCFRDIDGDTYGSSLTLVPSGEPGENACDINPTFSTIGGDCDDTRAEVSPGGTEIVGDDFDNDCSGKASCYTDGDGDQIGNGVMVSADSDCADSGEARITGDCNDSNPLVAPNRAEIPGNGVDNDCDTKEVCYVDGDTDGYAGSTLATSADLTCSSSGLGSSAADCNDAAAAVHPGAAELIGNGADEDCSGADACYTDNDADGIGSALLRTNADSDCTDTGESSLSGDCNDFHPYVSPALTESAADGLDGDCDGKEQCYADLDGDGFASFTLVNSADLDCTDTGEFSLATDCDDTEPTQHPGAVDIPGDGIDQDCDTFDLCYSDADGDGYGSAYGFAADAADCSAPNLSDNHDDCNDTTAAVQPGATETAGNLVDENCDGNILCLQDADHDGFGTGTVSSADADCNDSGETLLAGDCNDLSASQRPYANEIPGDGVDSDCDGKELCYTDADADGAGSTPVLSASLTCAGAATIGGDCNDSDSDIYASSTEIIGDGVDQDCDGGDTCYLDLDGDGVGSAAATPSGDLDCSDALESSETGDCNDLNVSINPDEIDVPGDGVDQDCDGDELCFEDADDDGFGGTDTVASADLDCQDAGESGTSLDCDDSDEGISPADVEACDGSDNDCDGNIDESGGNTSYLDADLDGYGGTTASTACTPPPNHVVQSGDCDDSDDAYHPGATENDCDDPHDYNCDGSSGATDNDSDGFAACDECDDENPLANPARVESCNGFDDDCDGEIDPITAVDTVTFYADGDGDGHGDPSVSTVGCAPPEVTGWVLAGDDCDDEEPAIHPGATEDNCSDPVDYNCDGSTGFDDLDQDGATACSDCDDQNADVRPNADEACNEIDDDCDGDIDEDVVDTLHWYPDLDGDGYGDESGASVDACVAPANYVANGDDCNDDSANYHPGAPEIDCSDPADYNCDGSTGFSDEDEDGYAACEDCNDEDDAVSPGAEEACNGADDNCNTRTDESFPDSDFDGSADCMDADDDNDGLLDADDTDPLNPDADGNGISDGLDAIRNEVTNTGCSTLPGSVGPWAGLAGLLAFFRRRKPTT